MHESLSNREEYWKTFYKSSLEIPRIIPSQFAAFVAQEIPSNCQIIDLGCGNGRDTLFFAGMSFRCIGVDQCAEAIAAARRSMQIMNQTQAQFEQRSISDLSLDRLMPQDDRPVCAYARFFIHAITEAEQALLFHEIAMALRAGDLFALEYRTLEDQEQMKEASPHFRRYQSSSGVDLQLTDLGFEKVYGVEGVGFAKYQSEDAHVARGIYKKH